MVATYLQPGSRFAAVAAASLGLVFVVGYLGLANGTRQASLGLFYAAFVGSTAAAALASAIPRLEPRFRQVLLYGASSGYLLAGIVGLASIGLLLVVAALLSHLAVGERRIASWLAISAMAVPIAVFVGGITLAVP